jgi:N-acetylglucosamine-6-phosphate deacetylase
LWFGVTSILPTLITDTDEVRNATIAAGIEAAKADVPGFAGLHLEGPHLSLARKGAHDAALVRPMTDKDVATLVAARRGLPALMTTLAPESATPEQVSALTKEGVKVSIGHSDAGIDEVLKFVRAGASMVTHLFNAQSQMTGREPGVVGAALSSGDLNAGLIADGYHVHPASIGAAIRAKAGPGRVFLISDAMSTVGTDVTELVLNGRKVTRADGRLTLEDGTLAGADLELATAVRVLHQKVGIDLDEALRMASLYPSQAIGLADRGQLVAGVRADFAWFGADLQSKGVWINGVAVDDAA